MAGQTSNISDQVRRHLRRVIATIVLALGVIAAFMLFIQDNANRIYRQNEEYLVELTAQRAISIDNLISENLTFIKSTAYLYGESLDSSFADVAVIRDYEENSVFDLLRFIDASGDDYTSRGVQANLSDRPYFQAGMRGESGTTYVLQSKVTGQRQLGFYAPVYFEGDIIGVMVGFYGEDYVRGLLEYGLFGYGGEGWLCTTDGTVLGSTLEDAEPNNYLDYLREGKQCTEEELARVSAAFAEGASVSFSYEDAGEQTVAYAVPLDNAEWILVRNFPASATSQILSNANHEGILLLSELVAMFLAYGLFLAVDVFVEQRRTREANRNANDISAGVSTLFANFVVIDLDSCEYRYIGGEPLRPGLAPSGDYVQYRKSILAAIHEDDQRAETAAALTLDGLRRTLTHADSTSLQVHAPVAQAQWLTYNFIVIERTEGGVPARLLVTSQDVTELHHKEELEQERLQQALDVAESASKAKTEFLFNMSHDLRTPMNAIIGYTDLALRDGVSKDEMRSFIKKIDASSLHLLALINDILEMSRIESGKMTLMPDECDLSQVIDEARSLFVTQMKGKDITFTVDACSSITNRWVLCDRNRLNRVVLNLISNAYKFTPEGGRVTVELAQVGAAAGEASYTLRVADTGIGMSPEFVTKLFSPFERERTSTVSRTQGTGLGLSITKKIVDLMGGTIEVHTEQGKGSEFVVHLSFPVVEDPQEEAHAAEVSVDQTNFEGVRLLLVEDQPINMEIATMILSGYGFVLDTATNGQEAVDKVAAARPGDYDVVLMDIQMPVKDGYTAAREIRALPDIELSGIPIVAMTANAFQEDIQAARDAGMNGHIAKPIDVNKMLATLAEVLGR